jgi:hypothetical protein
VNRRYKVILYLILTGLTSLFLSLSSVYAEAIKTDLIIERNHIQSIIDDSSSYMDSSIAAFNTDLALLGGLVYVDSVISDPLVEQTIVDQLTLDLQTLQNNLVTKLAHAVINVDFQVADSSNLTTYTLRSRTDFHDELDRIEAILNNPRSGDTVILALETDIELSYDLLVLLADKTNLNDLMSQAITISTSDGTLYTPNSFALYTDAFNAFDTIDVAPYTMTVNEIYQFNDASVEEAEAAINQITIALDLLVLRTDKSIFINAFNTAKTFDLSSYTPNSIDAFNEGLDLIEAVINDPNALWYDVINALGDLDSLRDVLVELADVSTLETLNTLALLAYYEERLLYTEESHNLFKAAVLDYGTYLFVNNVISNLNVTQAEVDSLVATIQNALDLLVERGNITDLQNQYDQLLLIDLTNYTPNSIALFQVKLSDIHSVILSPNTTQAIANATFQEALFAETLLINLADKTLLIQLIDSTKSLKATDYTLTSFGYLQSILDTTVAFILDLNVSQKEVDELYLKLDEAIKLLRTKLSPVVLQAMRGSIDINQFVVVGDSTVVGYYSSNPDIVQVSSEGMVEGFDYGQAVIRVELANGLYEEIPMIIKAKVKTSTFILVVSLPALTIGIAFVLLSTNVEPSKVINRIRKAKQI